VYKGLSEAIEKWETAFSVRRTWRLGGCRVLVVEAAGDSAACLTAMLRLNGFDARASHTGKKALSDLASLQPRAVILDLDLPDMDSCEMIRQIRTRADSAECAVIVVTAHADQASRDAALAAGADDYHLKPADPLALVKSLWDFCSSPE
jgi:DNA-binding response OmpR family regulator